MLCCRCAAVTRRVRQCHPRAAFVGRAGQVTVTPQRQRIQPAAGPAGELGAVLRDGQPLPFVLWQPQLRPIMLKPMAHVIFGIDYWQHARRRWFRDHPARTLLVVSLHASDGHHGAYSLLTIDLPSSLALALPQIAAPSPHTQREHPIPSRPCYHATCASVALTWLCQYTEIAPPMQQRPCSAYQMSHAKFPSERSDRYHQSSEKKISSPMAVAVVAMVPAGISTTHAVAGSSGPKRQGPRSLTAWMTRRRA